MIDGNQGPVSFNFLNKSKDKMMQNKISAGFLIDVYNFLLNLIIKNLSINNKKNENDENDKNQLMKKSSIVIPKLDKSLLEKSKEGHKIKIDMDSKKATINFKK